MLERVAFARGAWYPCHRPDVDCWCRPLVREEGDVKYALHRNLPVIPDTRERAFVSGGQGPS